MFDKKLFYKCSIWNIYFNILDKKTLSFFEKVPHGTFLLENPIIVL